MGRIRAVSDRPRIGISACLLGEPVRYDAGHKRDAWIVEVLGPTVEWVPVCPEVEAGFGTPREAMRLVRTNEGGIALMTTGEARDVTERMRRYAHRRVEELLEIRLYDRPFAVIMRTPGADRELAAGFLLAERVIAGIDDLGTIAHCADPAADHRENIVNVTLANRSADAIDRLLAGRRQVTGNSSCGLCGRRTIESLASDTEPIRSAW